MQKRAQQGKGTDYATAAEKSAYVTLSISCPDAHSGFDILFFYPSGCNLRIKTSTIKLLQRVHIHPKCVRIWILIYMRYGFLTLSQKIIISELGL